MPETDPMLEIYIYENTQLLERLEEILLMGEKSKTLSSEDVDEIFRIMHTIKGSSGMMNFDIMMTASHAVEDLFSQIRDKNPRATDSQRIFDIVLGATDFLKAEMIKITQGSQSDGDATQLVDEIHRYLEQLSKRKVPPPEPLEIQEGTAAEDLELDARYYKSVVTFETDCKMENVRAFGIVTSVTELCSRMFHIPEDVLATGTDEYIIDHGFTLYMRTDVDPEMLKDKIAEALFVKTMEFSEITEDEPGFPEQMKIPKNLSDGDIPVQPTEVQAPPSAAVAPAPAQAAMPTEIKQSFISVNINKLDKLMNLVGEIVTNESMVTKNPDLAGLELDNFEKSARQLNKLTGELQDVVMSIRMIPISSTFHKMHRLVRDMSKKVNKPANLVLIGEETEVDKNIIDNLSDPLMHIIRNSMDHGLESPEARALTNKPAEGTITLEARNTGSDVIIIISDDGRGLDYQKIVQKAIERGVTNKSETEITEKEAYGFIMLPGFSTKDQVAEFSGRGVGMDVVRMNIEKVGGTMSIDSVPGQGMTVTIKIPLTLAILAGMQVRVGKNTYIVPVLTINQSLRVESKDDIIIDPDGNEMIMIRGDCLPIVRLSSWFDIETEIHDFSEGILMILEADNKSACLFVDALIGEVQAVVKPLPTYIAKLMGADTRGLAGCSLMGDGSISLILNVNSLIA